MLEKVISVLQDDGEGKWRNGNIFMIFPIMIIFMTAFTIKLLISNMFTMNDQYSSISITICFGPFVIFFFSFIIFLAYWANDMRNTRFLFVSHIPNDTISRLKTIMSDLQIEFSEYDRPIIASLIHKLQKDHTSFLGFFVLDQYNIVIEISRNSGGMVQFTIRYSNPSDINFVDRLQKEIVKIISGQIHEVKILPINSFEEPLQSFDLHIDKFDQGSKVFLYGAIPSMAFVLIIILSEGGFSSGSWVITSLGIVMIICLSLIIIQMSNRIEKDSRLIVFHDKIQIEFRTITTGKTTMEYPYNDLKIEKADNNEGYLFKHKITLEEQRIGTYRAQIIMKSIRDHVGDEKWASICDGLL